MVTLKIQLKQLFNHSNDEFVDCKFVWTRNILNNHKITVRKRKQPARRKDGLRYREKTEPISEEGEKNVATRRET